jgi:hypothetical protein
MRPGDDPRRITSSTRETRITVKSNGTPQLAPAMALVELLQAHPELPAVSWDIQEGGKPVLHGHIHRGDMDALRAYAEVLGGGIRPVQDFVLAGRPVRSHYLTTVWRDVPVELVVVVPLPTLAGAGAR